MSTTVESKTIYTPEDLLAAPDGKHYELIDGSLVERNVSALSSLVAATLGRIIGNHCVAHKLKWVFDSECGFRCFPDRPGKVRRADVSYVREERLTADRLFKGFVELAPDLVSEVLSPNDMAYEVDRKINEYLRAGVRLIWVINPELRSVRIHRLDRTIGALEEQDELDGEDVLPGFRCRLSDLFADVPQPPQGE